MPGASRLCRVPSMPNTRLNIDYANFDDYMNKAVGQEMRRRSAPEIQGS